MPRRIEGKYVPGQMSKATVEELGRLQSHFLDEITASEETAQKARLAYPDYYKRGNIVSSN